MIYGFSKLSACRTSSPKARKNRGDGAMPNASGERLLGAVRRTLEGESPLNQELAMRLLVRLAREERDGDHAEGSRDALVASEPAQPEGCTCAAS
jgi:hypothetical protein